MNFLAWEALNNELGSLALTVRAQALPPNDQDQLVHEIFFPRKDVISVKLNVLLTTDFRPVSDRREWNARGRVLPLKSFKHSDIEMIPIEDTFSLGEREMQSLVEQTFGNQDLIRQIIGVNLPDRVDEMVNGNRRRIEFDAMRAWATGTITAMNPTTGTTATVSYGFDPARYQTAAVAWGDVSQNAYQAFINWVEQGRDYTGGNPAGAIMRRSTFDAIRADAPRGFNQIELARGEFRDRISKDLGYDFTLYVLENSFDVMNDHGLNFTRTKVWPANTVALVPDGTVVGEIAYAPIVRAYTLAQVDQDAQIDVRGMLVVNEVVNNGRGLTTECQINAFPIPNEQQMWVINAGV